MSKILSIICKLLSLVVFLLPVVCCRSLKKETECEEKHGTFFVINPKDINAEGIVIKANIDTISCVLLFDTGACGELKISESLANKLNISQNTRRKTRVHLGFEPNPQYSVKAFDTDTTLSLDISNKTVAYRGVKISDDVCELGVDGIFAVNYEDSCLVWTLNFDESELIIEDTASYRVAPESFEVDFKIENKNIVIKDLPLLFVSGQDSISYVGDWILDTGNTYFLSILGNYYGHKLLDFLSDSKLRYSSLCLSFSNMQFIRTFTYVKECNMLNDTIEVMEQPVASALSNIIGLAWIFNFNTSIAIAEGKIYFSPRKNNKSLEGMLLSRDSLLMTTRKMLDGNYFVEEINKNSFLYVAGLRKYDKIIAFDKKKAGLVNNNYLSSKSQGDTIAMQVIRVCDTLMINAVKN